MTRLASMSAITSRFSSSTRGGPGGVGVPWSEGAPPRPPRCAATPAARPRTRTPISISRDRFTMRKVYRGSDTRTNTERGGRTPVQVPLSVRVSDPLRDEPRDGPNSRWDRAQVVQVLEPESLAVALHERVDVRQMTAFREAVDRRVVDVDPDLVDAAPQKLGDVESIRRRPDRSGAAAVDEDRRSLCDRRVQQCRERIPSQRPAGQRRTFDRRAGTEVEEDADARRAIRHRDLDR